MALGLRKLILVMSSWKLLLMRHESWKLVNVLNAGFWFSNVAMVFMQIWYCLSMINGNTCLLGDIYSHIRYGSLKFVSWDSVGKPTESYFIWLTGTNYADEAIKEEWQMACEELAKEDSYEGEDKAPQA